MIGALEYQRAVNVRLSIAKTSAGLREGDREINEARPLRPFVAVQRSLAGRSPG